MSEQKSIKDFCLSTIEEIWADMGSGYDECIYQRCFEVALSLSNVMFERKRGLQVFFKGCFVGDNEIDLVVNNELIIEIKAFASTLSPKEEAQITRYMQTLNIRKGILVNFPQIGRKDIPNEPEVRCIEV